MINTVKMVNLPKAIYRLNVVFIKISTTFFTYLERTTLNFTWKTKTENKQTNKQKPQDQKHRIAKTILNTKRTARDLNFPDFKLYYRAMVIKTAWHKNMYIDQCNQIEYPDVNSNAFGHLNFDKKKFRSTHWKKGQYL